MEKIYRIAQASVWHVFFGTSKGVDVFVGDEVSMGEFMSRCRAEVAGFVEIEKVLDHLGIAQKDTPFVQVPCERPSIGRHAAIRGLGSDYLRPSKESLMAFATAHGKKIVLYSLHRDMYDGLAVTEQHF